MSIVTLKASHIIKRAETMSIVTLKASHIIKRAEDDVYSNFKSSSHY